MKRSWKTTLFGFLLAVPMALQQYGVKVGRIGQGDYLGLIQVVAAIGLGATAKDQTQPDSGK